MRTRSDLFLLALFLGTGLATSVGCVHTGIGSPEGWNVSKSKHFNVITISSQLHSATQVALEYQYAALSASFFNKASIAPVDVLFLDEDDFLEMMGPLRSGAALAKVPGKGKLGSKGLLIVKNDSGGDSSAEALTHLFIDAQFPKAPLWFHEGFASYARTVQYKSNGQSAVGCFGLPAGGDTLVPVEKLLSMSWDDLDGDEMRSWAKFTGRAMIDYLFHADDGSHRKQVGALISGVAEGQPGTEILKAAFPSMDIPALDLKLKQHGADIAFLVQSGAKTRGLCPIAHPIDPDKGPDQGERKMVPVPPSDMKELLDAVKRLPRRDGYPSWYPAAIIDKVPASGG